VALGLWAGGQVLYAVTYAREDWRGLAQLLTERAGTNPMVWLPDPGTLVPLRYYYKIEFQPIDQAHSAACQTACWYVLRQPFTATHAFSQSIADRPWKPNLPQGCTAISHWSSPTGLKAWQLVCS
jgi:hypothetical protein